MNTEKFFVPELNQYMVFVKLGIYYRPSRTGTAINVYYCLDDACLYTNTAYDQQKLCSINSDVYDLENIRKHFEEKIRKLMEE